MWNAEPYVVPWGAVSLLVTAGVIPAGQSVTRPNGLKPLRLRNRMATWPGGIWPPARGAYVIPGPLPLGMYANFPGSSGAPSKSTLKVTGVDHVLTTNAAKQAPAPSDRMSGPTT